MFWKKERIFFFIFHNEESIITIKCLNESKEKRNERQTKQIKIYENIKILQFQPQQREQAKERRTTTKSRRSIVDEEFRKL